MAIEGNVVTTMSPFDQDLASYPMLPRKITSGDGTEGADNKGTLTDGMAEEQQVKTLENADPGTAYRTIDQLVRSQDVLATSRWAIDNYHSWIDQNIPFARLEKIPNQNIWVSKLPPGSSKESSTATPNHANDLNNKVTETLLADPAKPNPQVRTNNEGAKQAGDMAAQFLRTDGGPLGTDDVSHWQWALRNGLVRCSSFLHYTAVEGKGGYQPYQVLAHPQAQDPANPMVVMVPGPVVETPEGPIPGPMIEQPTVNPILRYVSPAGEGEQRQFVETAAEADRVWLPAINIDRLTREQVRTFPATAPVHEADVVVLLLWCTLSEGRKKWESVRSMDSGQLNGLASWRPTTSERIVPFTFRGGIADGATGPALTDVGNLSPLLQRRMFYYRVYIKPEPTEYPNGLCMDISGASGGTILESENLDYLVKLPDGGKEIKCRDIPVDQLTPVQDVLYKDPMGWAFINRFAGSSEATATLYAAYLDALDQRLHPHVFIRSTAPVDDEDWADRYNPIILNPTDPEPTYENFSPVPDIVSVAQDMRTQQDTSSGLTATAQGLDSENAQSGIAKKLTVRQAQISLSGIQQAVLAFIARGWTIKTQIAQAKFETAQLLKYDGEDGSSELRWFKGQDLAGIDEIGIEPGTGTMMTAEDKANYVAFLQGQMWLTPDRAAEIGMAGISRDLGLPPDPVEQAIERAVTAWLEGPPQGWTPAAPQINPLTKQPMIDPVSGQPVITPPSFDPFAPKPNDTEQEVATKWAKRLSKLMMDPEYDKFDPAWRSLVDQKYMAARQALTPPAPVDANGNPQAPGQIETPQTQIAA